MNDQIFEMILVLGGVCLFSYGAYQAGYVVGHDNGDREAARRCLEILDRRTDDPMPEQNTPTPIPGLGDDHMIYVVTIRGNPLVAFRSYDDAERHRQFVVDEIRETARGRDVPGGMPEIKVERLRMAERPGIQAVHHL